jgi:hypothetical protein
MNIPIFPIFSSILQIFGLFAVGWFARYKNAVTEQEIGRWSRFLIDWLLPMLIFSSVAGDLETDRLRELWVLPLVGLGMMVFGAISGIVLKRGLKNKNPDVVQTFHYFCAINNFGFLPIVIVQNTWGETALAHLFIFNLGSQIGLWTLGVGLLGGKTRARTIQNALSPSLVALILALGICLADLQERVPKLVLEIARSGGSASVPLILILVGATLYRTPIKGGIRDIAYLGFVRLVLLPVLMIAMLFLLPLPPAVYPICLVVALMPVSVSATVLTRRYGGSPAFAATAALLTTLASLATVPLGLWMVNRFLLS